MAVAIQELDGGKILEVRANGKLSKEAYEYFVPLTERLIGEHGKIRVLFEMHDFHGWEAGALWQDIKFDLKHFRDIERLGRLCLKNHVKPQHRGTNRCCCRK